MVHLGDITKMAKEKYITFDDVRDRIAHHLKIVEARPESDFMRGYWQAHDDIWACVKNATPREVKPVVHSKWELFSDGSGRCLNCRNIVRGVWDFDNCDNFCKICGADMREVF